jgi:hypothetical protein
MTVGLADLAPAFMSRTGATTYDPVMLDADEVEADRQRTHVFRTGGLDPVLRDVLVTFQDTLVHRLAAMATRISGPSSGVKDLAGFVLFPGGPSVTTEILSRTDTAFAATVLDWSNQVLHVTTSSPYVLTGTPTPLHRIYTPTPPFGAVFNTAYVDAPWRQLAIPSAGPPVVGAIEEIATILGAPVSDVLKSSGIAKRTYQQWKKGTKKPRVSSQGRVWELHQLAEDLREVMGVVGVQKWLSGDPVRRRLLRAGEMDRLASLAYAVKAPPLHRWSGVGSPELHALPSRDVQPERMDAGDVVEAEP